MPPEISKQNSLDRLAEEFVSRYRDGERPTASEYAARYPELAGEIEELFPMLLVFEQARSGESADPAASIDELKAIGRVPVHLGDYRILRCLGRGGMGVVYEAIQEPLGRHVALKVFSCNHLTNPVLMKRFYLEARAAASLHHTNIVPVFDVGQEDGMHYYAMQYIQGQSLHAVIEELRRLDDEAEDASVPAESAPAQSIAQGLLSGQLKPMRTSSEVPRSEQMPLADHAEHDPSPVSAAPEISLSQSAISGDFSTQSRFQYFRRVASIGIQVAEALGYAHQHGIVHRDVKPSNLLLDIQGRVWITDFGLAKAEGSAELTRSGDLVGTLRYMAPERFKGRSDALSDIYGVGVTLYELLAHEPAFQGANHAELLLRITKQEPVRLRERDSRIPRDLETIVHKSMDKSPGRRYQSAQELAADLQRFIEDKPIYARRTSRLERLWRWSRRNPALATASSLAVVVLLAVIALAIGSVFTLRLQQEKEQTAAALQQADELRSRLSLQRGMTLCEQGDVPRGMLWLGHSLETAPASATTLERDIRESLAVWHSQLHPLRAVFRLRHSDFTNVVFSPDGKFLVTKGDIKSSPSDAVTNVRLYDAVTGQPLGIPIRHDDVIQDVAFSPDSRILVTASRDQTSRLWDVPTGKPIGQPLPHQDSVISVAFMPDSKSVLTVLSDGTVQLWDVNTGHPYGKPFRGGTGRLAVRPDGNGVLIAEGNVARLWDLNTGQTHGSPLEHPFGILCVAFSPDGKTAATGGRDLMARLWDADTGEPRGRPLEALGWVYAVSFSPDGRTVATGRAIGEAVQFWDVETGRSIGHPLQHQGHVFAVGYSADGDTLSTWSSDNTVRRWDMRPCKPLGTYLPYDGGMTYAVAFSRDGRTVAAGGQDGIVRLWDAVTGPAKPITLRHQGEVWGVAFSSDGRTLVTGSADGTAQLWDVDTGEPLGKPLKHRQSVWVWAVAFSPNGQTVLTGSHEACHLWDVNAGKCVSEANDHKGIVWSVAFSPDGKTVLTGSADGTVQLRDAVTLQPIAPRLSLRDRVYAVGFSPDGRTFATGCSDGTAQLWDVATCQPRGAPLIHQGSVYGVAFSPDSKTLVTGSADGSAQIWDVETAKPIGMSLRHRGTVWAVAFSPDGKTILTGSYDAVRLWQPPAPVEGDTERINLWVQTITGLELEESGVVRVLDAESWHDRRRRLQQLGGPPLP
jgi:WD40 repeat protein/tRNA A-37 threonylcarbamoyl transferase component Bud32